MHRLGRRDAGEGMVSPRIGASTSSEVAGKRVEDEELEHGVPGIVPGLSTSVASQRRLSGYLKGVVIREDDTQGKRSCHAPLPRAP